MLSLGLRRALASLVVASASGVAGGQAPKVAAPTRDYFAFVASEGNDRIALIRFGSCATPSDVTPSPASDVTPSGASAVTLSAAKGRQLVRTRGFCARVEREHRMGTNPTELVGPHGLGVSPDGRHYYVSTAHGTPSGSLWKFSTVGDSLLGRVELGSFPASLHVTPNGAYVFVVNFNLHGDMVPSSVSIVYAEQMVEVARVQTCVMPHGSRLNPQGTKHYSACMMDDVLVEIDAVNMRASRHFMLARGQEHGMAGAPNADGMRAHVGGAHGASCSPTWAQPSADGSKIFVACNKSNEIVEIDAERWTMTRRIPAGDGVYNLAVTRDGRLLIATNKRGQSVSIIDIARGTELARVATTRTVPSGVAISADDRFAFVTDEGVGSQPGTVDVIDLRALMKVATVDVGQQAGGIDVWSRAP